MMMSRMSTPEFAPGIVQKKAQKKVQCARKRKLLCGTHISDHVMVPHTVTTDARNNLWNLECGVRIGDRYHRD